MKRILPAGERYGFYVLKFYRFILFKNIHYGILLILLMFQFVPLSYAQISKVNEIFKNYRKESTSFKYYQIGDKLPKEFVLGFNPFDSTKVYKLKDFKGKPIILDFWASWCSGCIGGFPKMDSLSNKYKGKMEIILINLQGGTPPMGDTPEVVRIFLTNYYRNNPKFNLNVLIEKEPFQQFFNFRAIPHYIWIDRNRRIRAFTNTESVTIENIEKLFSGRPMKLPIKKN